MATTSRFDPGSRPDAADSLARPSSAFPAFPRGEAPSRGSSLALGTFDVVLAEFTARWERGESPRAEDFVGRVRGGAEAVELAYREFCLAERDGLRPRADDYLARFPGQAEALGRLFLVHEALGASDSRPRGGPGPDPSGGVDLLPRAGDEVGPYTLLREIGRGAFARVFLAEQADLADRLVVVKASARVTPEPRLLARASHPHIAEVLWHGLADGGAFQILCMPFLGGAPLSTVLNEARRRGSRPGSGRDLLADLDRASDPSYPVAVAGSPARDLVASLSYSKAAAWVVARLAGALDHAYSRGVLHGDVKPSNVLLAADGTPLLLDFNLAVGWTPWAGRGGREPAGDGGGTLAYMAPERLETVAAPAEVAPPSAADRHRADVYSLGVVLLEVLTGRAPVPPGPSGRPLRLNELASAYVSTRRQGGAVMIREARTPLPAGLRAVLARCLAPDPADRYARASELAEDLDRWRTDRPLAFARGPSPALDVARWARRRRVALAAGAVGLAVAAAALLTFWKTDGTARRLAARARYAEIVEGADSGAFPVRRPGAGVIEAKGDPAEVARRHLARYGVLDPGDWRDRDEFRALPRPDREDLEAWLMEQALRYAAAQPGRPGGPARTRQALFCLERVAGPNPPGALRARLRTVRAELGQSDREPTAARPAPAPWLDEYLSGVARELNGGPGDGPAALDHYKTALKFRPQSFWANYRAAAVAFALACPSDPSALRKTVGDPALYKEASRFLGVCVRQCPANPTLRRQYAGCLYGEGRDAEAVEQLDKASALNPDHAETYLSRAFLRLRLGQVEGYLSDLDRYEVVTGRREPTEARLDLAAGTGPENRLGLDLDNPRRKAATADPDELYVRRFLAQQLGERRHYELALREFDAVLTADPDNLLARYCRAIWRPKVRRDGSEDFARVVEHPGVDALVRFHPGAIQAFYFASIARARQGRSDDALQIARRAVEITDQRRSGRAESRINLAAVLALAAKSDPRRRPELVETLRQVFEIAPDQFPRWFQHEPAFEQVRKELGPNPFGPLPEDFDPPRVL